METITIQSQQKESSPEEPIIKVRNLTKKYSKGSDSAAIDHLSFDVGKELVTLFGPSGCGKTTTLRCIAGLERPDEGEITIGGKLVTSAQKGIFVAPEKRNIGLVFQSYALWPHMKVRDNVAYGLKVRHREKDEIRHRVSRVLEVVGLTGYEDRYPAQLSGGQQQRVALARSMVYEPKVLLLDEPLSNLDAKIREKTRAELKNLLKEIEITSVYVTHDQEEAFLMSDRIVVMNEGKIMQEGSPDDVYNYPANKFVASFVGRSNLVPGVVVRKQAPIQGDKRSSGKVRFLKDLEVECEIPSTLAEGEKCWVMVRSNEVGLSGTKPVNSNAKECEIISREYRGAVTDLNIKIDDTTLVVSAHKFALSEHGGLLNGTKCYALIRRESVSIVPEN